jgi:hypothetical protein
MENWQSVPGYDGLYRDTAPPTKPPLNTEWIKRFALRATVGFGSFLAVTTMIHAINAPAHVHTWQDDPIVSAAQAAPAVYPDYFGFGAMDQRALQRCRKHHRHCRLAS